MLLFETDVCRPDVPFEFLDDSLLNKYGEECVPVVVWSLRDRQVLRYRCLEEKWSQAFEAWIEALRTDPDAPQPMPCGHCMFVTPEEHGAVAWDADAIKSPTT
jgi:hypothetical protein